MLKYLISELLTEARKDGDAADQVKIVTRCNQIMVALSGDDEPIPDNAWLLFNREERETMLGYVCGVLSGRCDALEGK